MTREWLALYCALAGKPKYRRLTLEGRAALFHVWLLAGGQTPEATWEAAELAEILELDGFPRSALEELVALHWLDQDNGRLYVHDWDDWQLAATAAARKAYERDRKAVWRRRPPEPRPSPLHPSPDITGHDKTSHDITGNGDMSPSVRDLSGTRNGHENHENYPEWGGPWGGFFTEWRRLFRFYPPSPEQRAALWPVVDARPVDAAEWLGEVEKGTSSFEAVRHVLERWKALAKGATA